MSREERQTIRLFFIKYEQHLPNARQYIDSRNADGRSTAERFSSMTSASAARVSVNQLSPD
jgi:hypothetical protein